MAARQAAWSAWSLSSSDRPRQEGDSLNGGGVLDLPIQPYLHRKLGAAQGDFRFALACLTLAPLLHPSGISIDRAGEEQDLGPASACVPQGLDTVVHARVAFAPMQAIKRLRISRIGWLALPFLSLLLSGCFQVHAKLNKLGGALIAINYPLPKNSTLEKEKKKFKSPATSVKSAKLSGKRVQISLATKDITKISAAQAFKRVSVTRSKLEEGRQRLTVSITNTKPLQVKRNDLGVIKLTLPGQVLDTTATREVSSQVVWKIPIVDYFGKPKLEMSVTYAVENKKPAKAKEGSPSPEQTPGKKDG